MRPFPKVPSGLKSMQEIWDTMPEDEKTKRKTALAAQAGYGAHSRYHTNRGTTKAGCAYCTPETGSESNE